MQKRDKNHKNRDENVISSEGLRKKIQLRSKAKRSITIFQSKTGFF